MTAIFDERADDDDTDDPVQPKSCFYLRLDKRFHS